MKYKTVLLTGSSGKLGSVIIASGYFTDLLTPQEKILNIKEPASIKKFFSGKKIDGIIHCAALARMAGCESDPAEAIYTNIIGTGNLVMEVMRKENELRKKIRFIHISSDSVYPGTHGDYAETDTAIPYNRYGWSKLGAECAVNLLSNHCIIRTSFFDPKNIPFSESASDAYSSKVPLSYLVKTIAIMLDEDFVGTINIGGERKSEYQRYKEFKPGLKTCKFRDVLNSVSFNMARDASLNSGLWKKIEAKKHSK